MNCQELIKTLEQGEYAIISNDELQELLQNSKSKTITNTMISGNIYLLKVCNNIIVIEQSDKNELLARIFSFEDDAEAFVKDRMETYEKMWDGCGCKVKYY
jgi:hypothetical protein